MAYLDFPKTDAGNKERKAFWLSPDGITLLAGWRREGVSVEEIARRYVGVTDKTFWRWSKESKDLEDAMRVSSDSVNSAVEESLLRRALGYTYEEVIEDLVEGNMRVVRVVHKHMPADVKACLSWLYSRRSDRWRAIQEPIDNTSENIAKVSDVLVSIAKVANECVEVDPVEVNTIDMEI